MHVVVTHVFPIAIKSHFPLRCDRKAQKRRCEMESARIVCFYYSPYLCPQTKRSCMFYVFIVSIVSPIVASKITLCMSHLLALPLSHFLCLINSRYSCSAYIFEGARPCRCSSRSIFALYIEFRATTTTLRNPTYSKCNS
jgi:hypothetical protein